MHSCQSMAACCKFVFPSQLPDKVFHHNLGMVVYSFENVPANQFHNSDYRKSSYSNLTTHHSLKEKGKIKEINQSTKTSRRGPKLIFQVQEIDLKVLVTNLNCYELQGFLFSSFFGQPCTEFESPLDWIKLFQSPLVKELEWNVWRARQIFPDRNQFVVFFQLNVTLYGKLFNDSIVC